MNTQHSLPSCERSEFTNNLQLLVKHQQQQQLWYMCIYEYVSLEKATMTVCVYGKCCQ